MSEDKTVQNRENRQTDAENPARILDSAQAAHADRGGEYRAAHMKKALARKARRLEKLAEMEKERQDAEAARNAEDERYMRKALAQAEHAFDHGEVPIGCVIVRDGVIIARGYNRRNTDHSALSHAETSAIRRACRKLGDWRLTGCTLYCTLEPCPMCAGAIVQSRVDRVVIGAMSPKSGSGGSLINILQNDGFNHRCEVTDGILEEECGAILSRFFGGLRKKKAR